MLEVRERPCLMDWKALVSGLVFGAAVILGSSHGRIGPQEVIASGPEGSVSSPSAAVERLQISATGLVAPLESVPKYPFTEEESIRSGRWRKNSQDYPYFGAPRNRNTRFHAGVDIYPQGGAGSAVRALADGTVIKIAAFYTRANGEVTYGVLVDHGAFVANYAELMKPDMEVAARIRQGQVLGRIGGTKQLHLELYAKGTKDWSRWRGKRPENLLDPTDILLTIFDRHAVQHRGPAQ